MTDPANAEPKDQVEILPETVDTSSSQKLVEIDLKTGKPAEKVQKDYSVDPAEIERKLSARFNYELRQNQKLIKELTDKVSSLQVKPVKTEISDGDDFDSQVEQIAQTDWKRAVDLRAERIAKKLAEEQINAYKTQQKAEEEDRRTKETIQQQDEKSKQKVLKEYPDLIDDNSETFKTFMGIFNRESMEDPYFLHNPRKYEIVASEMRSRSFQPQTNPEVERLKRVAAGSSSNSRSVQSGNRIQLTQDEIDFCDRSGIPYSSFSSSKKSLEKGSYKEGLELKQ